MTKRKLSKKVSDVKIKQLIDGLEKAFISHEAASIVHVEPLARMLMDDPDKAIDLIVGIYNKALDDAYTKEDGENVRAFVEATCGGPYEAIPADVYNAVGTVYPFLDRERKDKALGKVLNIMDMINYFYVQISHTPFIREPLLLGDIYVARRLYWPGLDEGDSILKQFGNSGSDSFANLKNAIMDDDGNFRKDKVRSDFVVAYSLLRSDRCEFGELYANSANPAFLERTLQAITGMRFARAESQKEQTEGRERLKELLPETVQDKIDYHLHQADWVDYRKFSR